jgi:hypothetical protein
MAERRDQLIEGRVYAGSTYLLYLGFRVKGDSDALADFFFGLGNELHKVY